jgi:hypothetical protein
MWLYAQKYLVAKFSTQVPTQHSYMRNTYTTQGPDPFGSKTLIPDVSIRITTHTGTSTNFI